MGFTNSSLATYKQISPNRTSPRNHAIDTITPHCYVGQVTAAEMCSWLSNPSAQASANYVIGLDGEVGLNVEEKDRSWCSSSRDNDNRAVTIECASDKSHPYAIKSAVYSRLVDLMVDICKRNGKTRLIWLGSKERYLAYKPAADEMLLSVHRWYANKACPGDYIYNRLDAIATEVTSRLGGEPAKEIRWYRVRKTWQDEKSQLGAYEVLELAIENCPDGYSVFDHTGKAVYTPVDAISTAAPGKYPSGVPKSKGAYIEAVGAICRELMAETGILASVVTAQCCLETGFGLDPSCKVLMDVNNLLGMKKDLINNTWSKWSVWNGKSIQKKTPEYYGGRLTYIMDTFRAYTDYENCIRDYEMFLLHVRNGKGYKYASVQGMTDPAMVIRRIRIGTGTPANPEGYCTDPAYEGKILALIKEYDLTRFDIKPQKAAQSSTKQQEAAQSSTKQQEAAQNTSTHADKYVVRKTFADTKSQTNSFNSLDYAKREADKYGYTVYEATTGKAVYTPTKDRYAVRHNPVDTKYQLGLFHELKNAKSLADQNWGYKVYDVTDGSLVYEPKLAPAQKLVAEMVYMDLVVRDDIKDGHIWTYKNKNTSKLSRNFDDARKNNNRKTNCSTAVYWALLRAGVVGSDRKAIQWNGNNGFVWLNSHAKADALKYFNMISVKTKTMKKCIADGTVQPGDIISFVGLAHTCAYIAHGMTYDTGHHNCSGSGEGAKFTKWISAAGYQNYKVAEILRLK